MSEKNVNNGQNSAFAFSVLDSSNNDGRHTEYYTEGESGLSKREYAAIHLRVPDSGEEWLDEMIKKSNRMEAEKGIIGHVVNASLTNISCQNAIKIGANRLGITQDEFTVSIGLEFANEFLKQQNHE